MKQWWKIRSNSIKSNKEIIAIRVKKGKTMIRHNSNKTSETDNLNNF
ncbi:hypothetical protein GCM10011538_17450 [Ligilactobacillus murinus]